MKKIEEKILSMLKKNLLEVNKSIIDSKVFFGNTNPRYKNSEKAQKYYLLNKANNLYKQKFPNFKLGTGLEAVRSSAAMIYNLLGEVPIKFKDGRTFKSPEYEKEYEAILSDNQSKHKANIDAILISEDNSHFYAIEAKLLEWINCPKNLSDAYLHEENYLTGHDNDVPKKFIEFFKKYKRNKKNKKEERWLHKKERYDAIQMTIHILALYNACSRKEITPNSEIILYNVVWKYDCDDYKKEEKEAKEFVEDANNVFPQLFKNLGYDFKVEYITFEAFKNSIDFSDKDRENYLKRYRNNCNDK